ncbi:hypothetical protein D3C73_631160 [compost metagenome]
MGQQELRLQAKKLLAANPDIVFDERVRIEIPVEDVPFWLRFSSEWGGAVYLLDETNNTRVEHGLITQEHYEFSKRTYRLGLIILSGLYDQLKAWQDGLAQPSTDHKETYVYEMNTLDCFFIPAYLDDFSRIQTMDKESCEKYIQLILVQLTSKTTIDEAVHAIETMADEYIRNIHLWA